MKIANTGLRYFSVDVHFFEKESISIIINDFGLEATAVILKLYAQIFTNGYYIRWNEKIAKIFSTTFPTHFNSNKMMALVDALLEEDVFNRQLYQQYGILTSEEIQQNFFEAVSRRKSIHIAEPEYLMVLDQLDDSTRKKIDSIGQERTFSPQNVSQSEQSKVKESKENKSKACEKNLYIENPHDKLIEVKKEWDQWKSELLQDEDWQASLVRFSGKGTAVLGCAREAMDLFDDYVLLRSANLDNYRTRNAYQSAFVCWWRYNNWVLDMNRLRGLKTEVLPASPEEADEQKSPSRFAQFMQLNQAIHTDNFNSNVL